MKLVIVESPTKARTISKFLGADYNIKASMGHIVDLPKSTLGVAVDSDFAPDYQLVNDKKSIISELKLAAKKADEVILATDPDREGEAIAYHVADVLKQPKEKIKRIVFHEITKEAILEALNSPRHLDVHLVEAQTARRVLDRLVGYKLSPLLWQKVRRGLSAGRVQSVALRLIVEREREIEKFDKQQYYTIDVILEKKKQLIESQNNYSETIQIDDNKTEFELIEIDGNKIESKNKYKLYDGDYSVTKTIIISEKQAGEIEKKIMTKNFFVSEVLQKEMRRSPQYPFTTSTLQQEAARRNGFAGKRTMSLAQKLYEEGYITYHRTDSVNMSNSAIESFRIYIKNTFGVKYLSPSIRVYKTKQKLAQEAHEAIRPTKINVTTDIVMGDLGKDYAKLYDLIWRRSVAAQMADAITESTTVIVNTKSTNVSGQSIFTNDKSAVMISINSDDEKEYTLRANGSVLVFDGFLKINPQALNDNRLPDFITKQMMSFISVKATFHQTPPPPRYNDSSLIKTLEEKGIGRPSTYASIVSTIQDRKYIDREEAKFYPTSVGIAVNDFLVTNFPEIDDIPFTADMEDQLDSIADGKKEWVPMIRAFYTPLENKIEEVKGSQRVQIEVEKTDMKCEKCDAPMVIRVGKFGKFFSCSTFPKCDFSKQFVEDAGVMCPKDGVLVIVSEIGKSVLGKVIIKKTRKGRKFFGCSNYPKCDFATWKLEDIKIVDELPLAI